MDLLTYDHSRIHPSCIAGTHQTGKDILAGVPIPPQILLETVESLLTFNHHEVHWELKLKMGHIPAASVQANLLQAQNKLQSIPHPQSRYHYLFQACSTTQEILAGYIQFNALRDRGQAIHLLSEEAKQLLRVA
jgi:hypothetical protein